MNQRLEAELWETQVILYWILGFLIIHWGTWHWVGWVAIGWGWVTMLATIIKLIKAASRANGNKGGRPKKANTTKE